MGFTDLVEQSLLDHFFSDPAWTPPATMWLALSSTTPADDGTGFTEPVGGGYARVSTDATDWSAASGTAPAEKVNAATLTFPTATADWVAGANLTHFGIFSAEIGGDLLNWGRLEDLAGTPTPKPILADDTASFAAGALRLQLGDPADFA